MTKDVLKITVEGLGEVIGSAIARATGGPAPQPAAAPAPATAPVATPAAPTAPNPFDEAPAPPITLEVFRGKLSAFGVSEDNRQKIVAAIGKHGAAKVGEVPADKYAAVLADLGL